MEIDSCIEEKEIDQDRKKHFEDAVISYIKPQIMNPFDSKCTITRMESMFESMVATIQENWVVDMEKITEFEFYSKAKYLMSKHQPKNLKNGN